MSVWFAGIEFDDPSDETLLADDVLDAVVDAVDSMGLDAVAVLLADDNRGECRVVTFSVEFRSSTGVMDDDMRGEYWYRVSFDE